MLSNNMVARLIYKRLKVVGSNVILSRMFTTVCLDGRVGGTSFAVIYQWRIPFLKFPYVVLFYIYYRALANVADDKETKRNACTVER